MTLAMAAFAVEDLFIKAATRTLPVGATLILFGLFGMALFGALCLSRGDRLLHPAILTPVLAVRAGFEVLGRLFFTLAIALTPISSASAILQAAPLVVVAGAALFFGERVGPRRWAAIGVGFLGVLLILRPGLEGFSALSLLAVLGMLGFAGRDLATRGAPKTLSNAQLGLYGFAMLIPAGLLVAVFHDGARLPDAAEAGLVLGASLVGVVAYQSLTIAMRTGEVTAVTPFRYTRLVFAMLIGVLLFGERPDAATLAGSVIVVAAGLYILARSGRRAAGP